MASSVVAKFQPLQVQAVRNVPSSLQMSAVAAPLPKQVDIASQTWSALPDIWDTLSKVIGSSTAVVDNIHGDKVELTYGELQLLQKRLAGALQQLGIKEGDCVSLFSENSHRWLLMEQAIMRAGACNAVRGVAAPTAELQYIYENSESRAVVVEEAGQLTALLGGNGLRSVHGAPAFACVLYPKGKSAGGAAPPQPRAPGEELQLQPEDQAVRPLGGRRLREHPALLAHLRAHLGVLLHVPGGQADLQQPEELQERPGQAQAALPDRGAPAFETIYKGVQGQFQSKGKVAQKLVAFFTAACMLHTKLKRRARGLVVRSVPVPALE
eukprot:CAMPEP_0194705142 /NCGR_PEP_ID=MMETSP0295-20121207/28753_1 /TAXON_ID=39354 /ORGANISM="Heterosigma akashiwo, Strain CCMP2393" /LENGTH=324 /DNA_ID=CAMNT_0039600763 /DNA_START=209 /DNA_END=1182 /DNA_ORIENTATION=+